jgi:hypothetical protein
LVIDLCIAIFKFNRLDNLKRKYFSTEVKRRKK